MEDDRVYGDYEGALYGLLSKIKWFRCHMVGPKGRNNRPGTVEWTSCTEGSVVS